MSTQPALSRPARSERRVQSLFALVAAVGLAAAVIVVVVIVAALVVRLRAQWARVAVRVAGSWIAASGLLMLGWTLRGA